MPTSDDDSPIPFKPRQRPRAMPIALRQHREDGVIAEMIEEGRDDAPVLGVDTPELDLWSLAPAGGCPTIVGLDSLGLITCVEIAAYSPERRWARTLRGDYVRLLRPAPLPLRPEGSQ